MVTLGIDASAALLTIMATEPPKSAGFTGRIPRLFACAAALAVPPAANAIAGTLNRSNVSFRA